MVRTNLDNLLFQPDKVIAALFAGVGGFINFERDFDPVSIKSYGFLSAILAGCCVSIFMLYLIFRKYYRVNPFLFCCFLFLFLTYTLTHPSKTIV